MTSPNMNKIFRLVHFSAHEDELMYGLKAPMDATYCTMSNDNESEIKVEKTSFTWDAMLPTTPDDDNWLEKPIIVSSPVFQVDHDVVGYKSEWKLNIEVYKGDYNNETDIPVVSIYFTQLTETKPEVLDRSETNLEVTAEIAITDQNFPSLPTICKNTGVNPIHTTKLFGWTPFSTLNHLQSRCNAHAALQIEGSVSIWLSKRVKNPLLWGEIESPETNVDISDSSSETDSLDEKFTSEEAKHGDLIEIVCNGHSTVLACASVLAEKCKFLYEMVSDDRRLYLLGGEEGIVEQFINYLHFGTCTILEESNVVRKSKLFQLACNCEMDELQEACFNSMIDQLTIDSAPLVAKFMKAAFGERENLVFPSYAEKGVEKLRVFFRKNLSAITQSANFMRDYDANCTYMARLVFG